jgi:hypothetical protein
MKISGFFHFPEKSEKSQKFAFFQIFGAGAPVVSQRLFLCGPRKRVTDCTNLVIVYILARLRQWQSDKANLGVACADYSAFLTQCQVFFVTGSN